MIHSAKSQPILFNSKKAGSPVLTVASPSVSAEGLDIVAEPIEPKIAIIKTPAAPIADTMPPITEYNIPEYRLVRTSLFV